MLNYIWSHFSADFHRDKITDSHLIIYYLLHIIRDHRNRKFIHSLFSVAGRKILKKQMNKSNSILSICFDSEVLAIPQSTVSVTMNR